MTFKICEYSAAIGYAAHECDVNQDPEMILETLTHGLDYFPSASQNLSHQTLTILLFELLEIIARKYKVDTLKKLTTVKDRKKRNIKEVEKNAENE